MNIAIIPARGGSKRIPKKNIREFAGLPMIVHSIQAALNSNVFDHVIVSTDDDEIAQVAQRAGAQVPFKRPACLSDDFTGTVPVIAHAVTWVTKNLASVKNACCIYATAPFVTPEDINAGYQLLIASEADYAFSVTEYAFPIQRALKKRNDGRIEMFFPEFYDTRSQDLEEGLHDAGQFYWGTSEAWVSQKAIFSSFSIPVMLPRTRVQDIDTYSDWERAEQLYYLLKR